MAHVMETGTVVIDENRIRLLAGTLGRLPLAADFSAQLTPQVEVEDETAFRAYLWASAICHATKGGLAGYFSGDYYKGWDFLLRAFTRQAVESPGTLSPEAMEDITEAGLTAILVGHAEKAEVKLADLSRRAEILRTTSSELLRAFEGSVSLLLEEAEHTVGGDSGVYALLERLSAFRDPLHKKSSAFLMTVHFSGRWKIADQHNILPMIDYHRMRILLRTGCITVLDDDVARRLRDQRTVSPAVETVVREVSMRVCSELPGLAGMPMFDFDVLLWAHARSCCRNAPLCVSQRVENDSFHSYLASPTPNRCVFESWCPGKSDARSRDLWEPVVATENY
ncbi:queuosine salvage family protein [Streptosporangium sp. NPDC000563]|uniref:queuosine salvage family protein n=1 Tax=Streptosporangium sp. NPDC000563 TaxID=3154366 RepID=UPI0033170C23